jgi:hypothetical protein
MTPAAIAPAERAGVMSELLDFALRYARAGYKIIPVHSVVNGKCSCGAADCKAPGKHPRTANGAHDASNFESVIRGWWTVWPDANIGLVLDGLLAVDIDPRNGGDPDLLPQKLPDTCYARTGGGGWHHLCRARSGARYPGVLAPGVDLKHGAGSYIIVEPSAHASGGKYVWLDETEPWNMRPAEAPEWLEKCEKKIENISGAIPAGKRNAHLTSLAGSMRRRGMSPEAIGAALLEENTRRCAPPLDDNEVRRVAASVGRYSPAEDKSTPEWPEPLDIFRQIPAPRLEATDFPPILSAFAFQIARAAGHDPAGYAMAGLGAAAGAIGDDLRVLLDARTSWFDSARLWVLLVGAVGSAKTPAIRATMAPLFELHRRLRAEHAAVAAGLGPDDPKPPCPAVFATDATIEKLSEILHDNPRGIIAVFEELDAWLGAHDCYRGGQGSKDRGEWLRLFDGGAHQVDRIKRGSYFVANWGASILGATTPAGLRRHAHQLPPDGLIQRFLPIIVQPMYQPDETILATQVTTARAQFTERLLELHAAPGGVVRLSGEAAHVFFARRDALRDEVQAVAAFSEPLAGHVAKHAGLLGRTALAFHALEHGPAAIDNSISGETMERAAGLLRKITRHALALFDMLAGDDTAGHLARALGRSIVAAERHEVTRRDLREICRAFKTATEHQREAAIRLLVDSAWLTPESDGRQYDGRPARLLVAPVVFTRFREAGDELKARRAKLRELFAA